MMDKAAYPEAEPLAEALLAAAQTQAMHAAALPELAESYASLVCYGRRGNAARAKELLQHCSESPWGSYLLANLYWLENHHLHAMNILWEAFQPQWSDGKLGFTRDNFIWQATAAQQERILNFLGLCCTFFGMCELASDCFRLACDIAPDLKSKAIEYSDYLFSLHYITMPQADYFLCHENYGRLFERCSKMPPHDKTKIAARFAERRKIRLGYISPDFRYHVVLLFVWSMLTKYNRDDFELYLFSTAKTEDSYSEYLKQQAAVWFNVSLLSAEQTAILIYNHEIDILVDLAGHTNGNGLPVLAYKPAPVQVSGIGYFATTGLNTVDYFLTDRYLSADNAFAHFTEKPLILPHSHFCYTPLQEPVPVAGAPCNKNGFITFGSFNNMTKVNDDVLRVWAELLQQVPQSKLLLKCAKLGDADMRDMMEGRLQEAGISADRYELRGFSTDYLQEYHDMDIALDTFPYPGGGTTCDALYMGVPVVSLGDGTHGGNFGISLLKNIGLDFCCAFSEGEYIAKARTLAEDYELLEALHLGLRQMMETSPVMDAAAYMRDLEAAYARIWQNYLLGTE